MLLVATSGDFDLVKYRLLHAFYLCSDAAEGTEYVKAVQPSSFSASASCTWNMNHRPVVIFLVFPMYWNTSWPAIG